jgi:outer membrane protein assembly factor BamB
MEAEVTPDGPASNPFGPRYSLAVVGHRLYVRLGNSLSDRIPDDQTTTGDSELVCLNLAAQGRAEWRAPRKSDAQSRWEFEGSPVADAKSVYACMQYSDVRPQQHVACFDAETGAMRWRRLVCATDALPTETYNLLTVAHGVLYLNSNRGAVAAISADDGHICWLRAYPRARPNSTTLPVDSIPCVYDRGRLFVAPSDYEGVFALDAATGTLLWESRRPSDAVNLLGVGSGNLFASGKQLWWLDADTGKVVNCWPDQPGPGGCFGRGILTGDEVWQPTRDKIHIFRQAVPKSADNAPPGEAATGMELRDPLEIAGGNLVIAEGKLLVAGQKELRVYGNRPVAPRPGREVTQNGATSVKP